MRIVFFGSGEFAVPSLRSLLDSEHEVVRVVSQPDRPAGRGKAPTPTPVSQWALELGLPLDRVANVNDPAYLETLRGLGADIGVVVAFGQKLREPLRNLFPSQCVNIHASLLPKYRGAGPIAAAILAGETETGVSVFRLVDRMDAGPVLIRRYTKIGPFETASELHDRLSGIGCDAIKAALALHAENPLPPGEPQDESQVTLAPKLSKADGNLNFAASAEELARRCRAMWSWPGARCRYVSAEGRQEEVTLAAVTPIPSESSEPPGTITPQMTVATGRGTLEIHALQPAGKRVMGWHDFVNGRHVRPGDRFESL